MKTRALLFLFAVVVLIAAIASWHSANRPTAGPPVAPQAKAERKTITSPAPNQPIPVGVPGPVVVEETAAPRNNARPPATPNPASQPATVVPATTTYTETRPLDTVAKEELGRAALSYVGADRVADEVWGSLIYDTSLSDSVREDLMEDLNENGFSAGEGTVATVDDLPLIESRIVMLEEYMQGADDFMLEHLGEAHKDLVNMWYRLTGR